MKKVYYMLFTFMLLFIPTIVSAKTVTCTSEDNFTVGANVYDGISVTCSEGTAEIFAVEETSNELTWNPVVNPYSAVAGKKYSIDFVWTGTFDSSVDTMVVDGEDETDMTIGCDTGCHLYSKTVEAEPENNSNTEAALAVGDIYYVGDTITLNQNTWILSADDEEDPNKVKVRAGSYVLPTPEFFAEDDSKYWDFNDFLIEYDSYDEQHGYIGDPENGLYFGNNYFEISEDRVPIGIKCNGGSGTSSNPFTFEPVYASNNNPSTDNPDEPGMVEYTILEGANQTYIKGTNGTITIKASGELSKIIAIEIDNGNVIDPSHYELVSGSTVLTFKTTFLESSSVGEHTITFKYNDGEVETKLTIANSSDTNSSNTNPTPISNTNTTNNPQTGDNIMFYVTMLGLSVIGLTGAGLYLRKKKNN